MKFQDVQRGFTRGQVSGLMYARQDLELFRQGLAEASNMTGLIQGAMTREPGTKFIRKPPDHQAAKSRFIPFSFGEAQSYALLFGDEKVEVYRDDGVILQGGSTPTVASPYGSEDLANLDYYQSKDVIYFVDGSATIRRLERRADDDWAFVSCSYKNGPFLKANSDESKTFDVNGSLVVGATVTWSVTGFTLSADHVGALFRLEEEDASGAPSWSAGADIDTGEKCRWDGRSYQCTDPGKLSGVAPVHERGSWVDSNNDTDAVTLLYLHDDHGIIQILTVNGAGTSGTARIIRPMPESITANGTFIWREGAFSGARGGPEAIGYKGSRLWFAKGTELYATAVNGFGTELDFDIGVNNDDAISLPLQQSDPVRWIAEKGALLLGTAGSEISISAGTTRQPIVPDPLPSASSEGGDGALKSKPAKSGNALIYISDDAQRIVELLYDLGNESYQPRDLTLASEDVSWPGFSEVSFMRSPIRKLICTRNDGKRVDCVYDRANQVVGWWPHDRPGELESHCIIPRSDGMGDEMWLSIKRSINGVDVRTVERLQRPFRGRGSTDPTDAWYLDCALRYEGEPATVISGLSHLNGETVAVFADGAKRADATVSGGQITLTKAASKVLVGIAYESRARTLPVEFATREGSATARRKTPKEVAIFVHETPAIEVRQVYQDDDPDPDWELMFPTAGGQMSSPRKLRSGIVRLPIESRAEDLGQIEIRALHGFPMTILAIAPDYEVESR